MIKELKSVPVKAINIGDRSREDYGDLSELKESIKSDIGIIQPIAVQESEGEGYNLLAGGRRMAAIHELGGIKEVPAMVYKGIDNIDKKVIELSENIHRKSLSMQEELKMKKEIHDLYIEKFGEKAGSNQYSKNVKGWSTVDTAKLLGESTQNTSRDLRLARAVEQFPELDKCKTKHEANKALNKMAESFQRKEKAEKIERKESKKPEDVAKKELIGSYMVKDFFDGVKDVPDKTIDLCELDWPYGIDLDKQRKIHNASDKIGIGTYKEVQKFEYEEFVSKTLQECYRVMKNNSWILVWYGPEHHKMIHQTMVDVGFKMSKIPAIWAKSAGQLNQPNYYLSNNWEPFFYARKGKPTIINKGRSNIFKYNKLSHSKRFHPTEKPLDLMMDILSTFTEAGSKVLVPFLGSGNTILAANNLKMKAFGYDLDEEDEYKNAFTVRVHEGKIRNYKLR